MMSTFLKKTITASALLIALSGTTLAAEKPQIALLMKTLSNEYFITMRQGAEEKQKR